jgi:hypothetical protein
MGRRQRVGFVFREIGRVIVIGCDGDSRAAGENAGERGGDKKLERNFHGLTLFLWRQLCHPTLVPDQPMSSPIRRAIRAPALVDQAEKISPVRSERPLRRKQAPKSPIVDRPEAEAIKAMRKIAAKHGADAIYIESATKEGAEHEQPCKTACGYSSARTMLALPRRVYLSAGFGASEATIFSKRGAGPRRAAA